MKFAADQIRVLTMELDREIVQPGVNGAPPAYLTPNEKMIGVLEYVHEILIELGKHCPNGGEITIIEDQKNAFFEAHKILEVPNNFQYSAPTNENRGIFGFQSNINPKQAKQIAETILPVLKELEHDIGDPLTELNIIGLTHRERYSRR